MWSQILTWLHAKKLVETWMHIVWLLWNNRNYCFNHLSCRTPEVLVSTANRMKEDFLLVSRSNERIAQSITPRWSPPEQACVKLNVDAAFCPRNKVASLGMVVRNDTGAIRLCGIKKIGNVESPLQAELMAIAFGLQLAKEHSFTSIIVESDSLLAIHEIEKHHNSFCLWESIISDIVDNSVSFGQCCFKHIRRSANKCAHNVAKLQCELNNSFVWRNSIPPSLCNPDLLLD